LGLPHFRDALKRLEAPLGKFAVTGNQDVGWASQIDMLEGTGFRWLDRETVVVAKGADSIRFSGLNFVRANPATSFLKSLPGDRFNVFLYHTPDLIEDVSDPSVDLYLCGHTHGGQICLPWWGALMTFSKFGKKYESGLYRVGETTLYVNRGLGMEQRPAPQVRFWARPEIAVFDIVPEQE
jgi:predicted MPP superfamily phosphohydrolase